MDQPKDKPELRKTTWSQNIKEDQVSKVIIYLTNRKICLMNIWIIQDEETEAVKPVKTQPHLKQYVDWIRSEGHNDGYPKVILS